VPFFDLPSLRTRTLKFLQQGTAQSALPGSALSDSNIVDNINTAYRNYSAKAAEERSTLLVEWVNTDCANDSVIMDRRVNPMNMRFIGMSMRTSDAPVTHEYTLPRQSWKNSLAFPNQGDYSVENTGTIRLINKISNQWRIWFSRIPVGLHSGTCAGGTVNSVTFPSAPTLGEIVPVDDAYIGDLVYIISGPAMGQTGRITAYNATTRVATVGNNVTYEGNAFTTAPTTSSTYSLIPWFPMDCAELLALSAARMFTKQSEAQAIIPLLAEAEKRFDKYIANPDKASQQDVRPLNRGNVPMGIPGQSPFGGYQTWFGAGNPWGPR